MFNISLALKLTAIQTLIIALSNLLVNFRFELFNSPIAFSVFTIPLLYVVSDLTTRLVGKELARRVALLTVVPSMIVTAAILFIADAPTSTIVRITIASGIANLLACLLDIHVFQWIRERYTHWSLPPAAGGILSPIVSTYLFYSMAFAGGANAFMSANWHIVATNQLVAKIIFGLIVILPAYKVVLDYLQRKIDNEQLAQTSN